MYVAKGKGRARCEVFEPRMQVAVHERLELENDLRRAVDKGEFIVQYQPLVALTDGHITGVEALVRWRHPDRGLLAPLEFIPVAEDTGLIVPIGTSVLRQACEDVSTWQDNTYASTLMLSVNLSTKQLQHPGLLDDITTAITHSGIEPRTLTLELTESALLEHDPETLAFLHALKKLGLRLAIDDFGTGYSSLSYLERLPIDILKIDQAFVAKPINPTNEDGWALARSIIQLSQSLGLATVAEGIEYPSQWMQLRDMGCETGQGFLFGHPVDAVDIEVLLRHDIVAELPVT